MSLFSTVQYIVSLYPLRILNFYMLFRVHRDTFSSVTVDEATIKADIESLVQHSHFSDLGFVFVFRSPKV